MGYPGTDPTKLLHRVLIAPVVLERVPRWAILVILGGMAASLAWIWSSVGNPVAIAAGWLVFVLLDWIMLAQLPRSRRSFGPIHPPLLGLAGLRWALAAALSIIGRPWPIAVAMVIVSGLAWYGTWIEPFRLQLTCRKLDHSHWPAEADPIRLLHLSDLHLERAGVREDRLQQMIDQLEPDIICFSGDLLNLSYNDDDRAVRDAREVLGLWTAPYGVFAVTGSPLVDLPERARMILEGLQNVRWLLDETETLDLGGRMLNLVGLSCTHDPVRDGARLGAALQSDIAGALTVLLYHTPDLAPEAAAAGIDLHLSGHTHGGQIRLPFYGALITSSIYGKRFEGGEYHLSRGGHRDPMTLYVSRGIGMEGGVAPRARFLCRPEIILWTIGGSGDPI
jgi:predicted MPP superfamily phosphohydrolase